MQPISYRIALDASKMASQQFISVKKGDANHRLLITLRVNGQPYQITNDCSAVFTAIKSNGAIINNACEIKDNTIIYNITSQLTSTAGAVDCEVVLSGSNGAVLTSPRFKLVVCETVFSEEEVESEEYPSLLSLISQVNALIDDISLKLKEGDFIGEKGAPGVTPVLKGENNKLYVSYDDGLTWTYLQDIQEFIDKALNAEKTYNHFCSKEDWKTVSATRYKVKIQQSELGLEKPYIDDCVVDLNNGFREKAILDMLELLNGDIVIYSNLKIDCKIILKGE